MAPGFDLLITALLAIPLPLKYRIYPVSGTPYLLFTLFFVVLCFNAIIIIIRPLINAHIERLKTFLWLLTISLSLFFVIGTAIIDRKNTGDFYAVHDIVLQQESAIRYLIHGKNPYKETYFGTEMEKWHYAEEGKDKVNPALYHFIMPPWYLVFPIGIYIFTSSLFGFFDGRLALLFCAIGIIVLFLRWFKSLSVARLTAAILLLLPSGVDYLIEGRSDIFALFWFLLSIFLLEKKKFLLSAVVYGLAIMSKQTIWFSAPMYIAALWNENKYFMKRFYWHVSILIATSAVLVVPFLLWDAKAFVESVILFVSGGTTNGYPISGYGFGMILRQYDVIQNSRQYYPFIAWQLLFGLPMMVLSVWYYFRKPQIWRLFFGYALFLSVVWYFSRYFNNSHVIFLAQLFILAFMKKYDESYNVKA
jgi:hypothetical protein